MDHLSVPILGSGNFLRLGRLARSRSLWIAFTGDLVNLMTGMTGSPPGSSPSAAGSFRAARRVVPAFLPGGARCERWAPRWLFGRERPPAKSVMGTPSRSRSLPDRGDRVAGRVETAAPSPRRPSARHGRADPRPSFVVLKRLQGPPRAGGRTRTTATTRFMPSRLRSGALAAYCNLWRCGSRPYVLMLPSGPAAVSAFWSVFALGSSGGGGGLVACSPASMWMVYTPRSSRRGTSSPRESAWSLVRVDTRDSAHPRPPAEEKSRRAGVVGGGL